MSSRRALANTIIMIIIIIIFTLRFAVTDCAHYDKTERYLNRAREIVVVIETINISPWNSIMRVDFVSRHRYVVYKHLVNCVRYRRVFIVAVQQLSPVGVCLQHELPTFSDV